MGSVWGRRKKREAGKWESYSLIKKIPRTEVLINTIFKR
jgi:hypothetical protein